MKGQRIRAFAVAAAIAVTAVPIGLTASANEIGNEGCTPGFWKNHTGQWEDYTPGRKLKFLFTFPTELTAFGEKSMLQALNFNGGDNLNGAVRILLRAAVAAYLNAAHNDIAYPYRRFAEPGFIQQDVNNALASLDRATILALARDLDEKNNSVCPLDN